MIVKKIKQTNTDKPKEWQISDLVDYIRDPGRKGEGERVEYQGALNFLSDKPVTQKVEMIALARENNRTKTAVNHWLFSWPEGEQPTHEQVDELVKFFLGEMGLADHQAIYALHCDTRNYHVHIAVNRIHPLTEKAIRVNHGFDIRQAQKIRALIEKKQGWSVLENAPYVVTEEGELARRKSPPEPKPSQRAQDFEASTGQKSAQRIAQEKGHAIIQNAQSWEELHNGLKNIGMRFEKKGSGAIIWVGETAIKASSVDRSFSMGKLIKRLGEFIAGNYATELPQIEPEPLNEKYAADLQIYHETASKIDAKKREAIEQAEEELAELDAAHKKQREEIIPKVARLGKPFMNIGRHFLRKQQLAEKAALRARFKERLQTFAKPRFRAWMLMRGKPIMPPEARIEEKIRHTPAPISLPLPSAKSPQISAFLEYAKAVNAERYRVTSIKVEKDGSRKVLILDKTNGQTLGFTQEELLARMPEIQKLRQRGENIYYTPLSENQHHILIDDVNADNLVKLQQDGYRPAAIIESSPGNYQCILTFAKFGKAFDREIANRLAMMLNKKYGDPKLSGAIHPHRAPGFENRKEKHRRKDGTFPQAVLRYAVRQDCQKALVEARKIEIELKKQSEVKAAQRQVAYQPASNMGPQNAYFAHYADIRAHITIEDFSRVDAMIALRMRVNGHSPESVMAAIRDCAPQIREESQKKRDWLRYAERTVNYAFGYVGDRDITRYANYQKAWMYIESNNINQKYRLK